MDQKWYIFLPITYGSHVRPQVINLMFRCYYEVSNLILGENMAINFSWHTDKVSII